MTVPPLPPARLTVGIATTAGRLSGLRAEGLPVLPGVRYHICIQGTDTLPDRPDLARDDTRMSLTPGVGAARNRNAALMACDTPFLLMADDDLQFSPDGLLQLIARFDQTPEADFLCARLSGPTGALRKAYSDDATPVRWWNCGKIGTPEIALRPDRVRKAEVLFDTNFGAGMPNFLGDEYIFLCDALAAGLKGRHVAVVVASHPAESSGLRYSSDTWPLRRRVLLRALGPWKGRPALWTFAVKHRKSFSSWRDLWRFL